MKQIATGTSDFRDLIESESIYIFELKVGEPVDRAFEQIRSKGYATPYVASGKPIWLVGLSFDRETRKLVDCAAEPYRA